MKLFSTSMFNDLQRFSRFLCSTPTTSPSPDQAERDVAVSRVWTWISSFVWLVETLKAAAQRAAGSSVSSRIFWARSLPILVPVSLCEDRHGTVLGEAEPKIFISASPLSNQEKFSRR